MFYYYDVGRLLATGAPRGRSKRRSIMDPTFARQLGMAVQSDILRQAARDRQRRQARGEGGEWLARLVTPTRRLAMAMWRRITRRGSLWAPRTAAAPRCSRTNPLED